MHTGYVTWCQLVVLWWFYTFIVCRTTKVLLCLLTLLLEQLQKECSTCCLELQHPPTWKNSLLTLLSGFTMWKQKEFHSLLSVCKKHLMNILQCTSVRMVPLTWNALLSMCSPSLLPSRLMITCLPYNLRRAVKCLEKIHVISAS